MRHYPVPHRAFFASSGAGKPASAGD